MLDPEVLSDVLEKYDVRGVEGWIVFLANGSESCIYSRRADAEAHARREWPTLEDDLK